MIDKIINFLKHNFVSKLISVVVAFFIWLVVMNISNPEMTEAVTTKLDVLYEDEFVKTGKTYTIDTDTVRISYKIRSDYRRQVNAQSFTAYIDLRDYSVTGAVPVYVTVNSNVESYISDLTINPMVVHIDTEDLIEMSFPIEVTTEGQPAEYKVMGSIQLSSDEIVLYGPYSKINEIARVETVVDVSGATEDFTGTAVLVFYDSDGEGINNDGDIVAINEITYSATVYGTKELYISALVSGSPAVGHVLSSINVTPDTIEVYGPQETLDTMTTITIPEYLLDISEATRNVTVSLNVSSLLPSGVYPVGTGDVTVVAVIGADRVQNGAPANELLTDDDESESETDVIESIHDTLSQTENGSSESNSETSQVSESEIEIITETESSAD